MHTQPRTIAALALICWATVPGVSQARSLYGTATAVQEADLMTVEHDAVHASARQVVGDQELVVFVDLGGGEGLIKHLWFSVHALFEYLGRGFGHDQDQLERGPGHADEQLAQRGFVQFGKVDLGKDDARCGLSLEAVNRVDEQLARTVDR